MQAEKIFFLSALLLCPFVEQIFFSILSKKGLTNSNRFIKQFQIKNTAFPHSKGTETPFLFKNYLSDKGT